MSVSPDAVAIFKANAYSKEGVCAGEAANLRQAARDYGQAYLTRDSAWHNIGAAGLTTTASTIPPMLCFTLGPSILTVGCLVGTGIGVIGSLAWAQSAMEGYLAAAEEFEDQESVFDAAVKNFCKCLHKQH